MKCHFFHLMPYPELPEDFKQRYHSVWVDAPASVVRSARRATCLQ